MLSVSLTGLHSRRFIIIAGELPVQQRQQRLQKRYDNRADENA
jgi:hypothetical protein